jgi:hypothetical protein
MRLAHPRLPIEIPPLSAMPGIRTPDPSRVPVDPGKPPPPLPPGGRLPGETPPAREEDEVDPDEGDPTVRDPGRRMPPDHLPGGPSNPNPRHARSRRR